MNTWGYLLLITALLLLAGMMLYARFSSRSRAKSLHHAPADWAFPTAEMPASLDLEEVHAAEEFPTLRLDRVVGYVENEAVHAQDPERGYIDELQEAAAGLAKLMRSSPVVRTEPVVFAPEIEEAEATVVGAEILEEEILEDVTVPAHHEPSGEVSDSVVEDEVAWVALPDAAEMADEEIVDSAQTEVEDTSLLLGPAKVLSLRELLGDLVADQFDRIDAGLDALEDLVNSIEDNLLLLADLERLETAVEPGVETAPSIAAAA